MSGIGYIRLPSPPQDYDQGYMARFTNAIELDKQATQGYMARFTNAIELDKQATYFAADSALNNIAERAEATAWFMA